MSESIGRRYGCANAFGNKKNAAIGTPVNVVQKLFCLFTCKFKCLFHFGRIALDVFRERAIRYGLNMIAVFFCKMGCVIKKWFVSSISDAGKNNSQFWRIFVCSGSVCGSLVIEHLLMKFFLKFL